MKKLLQVLIPILCVPFLCGSKPETAKDFHVLKIAEPDSVVIDAGDNIAKPKMKFDIFRTGEEIPVARILITQTTPTYSIGFIVSRMDGSKPQISGISKGMLCRKTTKATLKAEKKIYNNQKKALKQQKKKAFNIQDLKLGMQKYEVEKICKGSLEFVATEAIPDSNGCSKVTYRIQQKRNFAEQMASRCPAGAILVQATNKDTKPYLLTFVIAPPITKEQCEQAIVQANITDSNDIQTIRSLKGFCFSRLVGVSQDMEMIKLQTIQRTREVQQQYNTNQGSGSLTPNSYGSGVYLNRYGQPVTLRPDFGGVPGERLEIKTDAYGFGVHADQYGRPVREYPWP